MFLAESMQKYSRRIGAVPTEQRDIVDQLCLEIYCII